jgi:parallel beta-helix repeat protein
MARKDRSPGRAPFRPCLEFLEPRCLPSAGPLGVLSWLNLATQAAHAARRGSPAVSAPSVEVHPGDSIQAAVDAAGPGTIVFLDPGTYDQTVTVTKPDVFLVGLGGRGAVTLANPGGAEDGITVRRTARGFGLFNVGVRGFDGNGVSLVGVRRFVLEGVTATDNGAYGIYPVGSSGGLIAHSTATGSSDTGIYVGQSFGVAVLGNTTRGNVNGIESENSVDVLVAGNESTGNTLGVLVDLLPGLPVKVAGRTVVAGNVVAGNNHPNFANPSDIAAGEPAGTGVFVLGAKGTRVEDNLVLGNESIGIGVVSSAVLALLGNSPPLDVLPNPARTHVRDNFVFGGNPFGADLLWDGTGRDSSWDGNTFLTHLSPRPFPS